MRRSALTVFVAAMVAIPVAAAIESAAVALTRGVGDVTIAALKDVAMGALSIYLGLLILRIAGGGGPPPTRPLWLLDRRLLGRWRARIGGAPERSYREA